MWSRQLLAYSAAVVVILPPTSEDPVERQTSHDGWLFDVTNSTSKDAKIIHFKTSDSLSKTRPLTDVKTVESAVFHDPSKYAMVTASRQSHRDAFIEQFFASCEDRGLPVICFMLPDVPSAQGPSYFERLGDARREVSRSRNAINRAIKGGEGFQSAANRILHALPRVDSLRGNRRNARLRLWHISQMDHGWTPPAAGPANALPTNTLDPHDHITAVTAQDKTPPTPSHNVHASAPGISEEDKHVETSRLCERLRHSGLASTQRTPHSLEHQLKTIQTTISDRGNRIRLAQRRIRLFKVSIQQKDETIRELCQQLESSQMETRAEAEKVDALRVEVRNAFQKMKEREASTRERERRISSFERDAAMQSKTVTTLQAQLADASAKLLVETTNTETLEQELRTTGTRLDERKKQVMDLEVENQRLRNSLLEKYVELEKSQNVVKSVQGLRNVERGPHHQQQ